MNFIRQIQQLWGRLKPRQRAFVAGGGLLTVVLVAALVRTLATPEYKPLMTGLEPADAQNIGAQLSAKKIQYQITSDGKGIEVAADQLDAARLEVASEESPRSGRLGFELFDKSSWGQTEFDEKVNYQRALEGELERTIQTLQDVKKARVHLVLPTASIFLDRERPAKASVTLRMKRGTVSRDQLNAIARLVSGAVDDLAPRDVTIIDADTNVELGNASGTMEGRELEGELSKRLVATLGPAVGLENLRTSVNVDYDLSSSEEQEEKYDPSVSAVLSSQKSKEQIGSSDVAGGVAGTTANLPAGTPGGASGSEEGPIQDGAQVSSSENTNFGVNKVVRHTTSPAGRIRRITAAILINEPQQQHQVNGKWLTSVKKRTPAELQQLTELARGVLGVDAQRGDVVTVQSMSFTEGTDDNRTPTVLDKVRTGLGEYSPALRYGSLLLLFLMVWALMFRPIQKQFALSMKELAVPNERAPMLESTANAQVTATTFGGALESEASSSAMKRELSELIQAEPASMARALQAWLREDIG